MRAKKVFLRLSLLVFMILVNCTSKKAVPILYGKDNCDHCKMLISDKRFGAELVTTKGKVYKFDSIECMTSFKKQKPVVDKDIAAQYLVNSFANGDLLVAEEARIYLNEKLHSPMGKAYFVAETEQSLQLHLGSAIGSTLTKEQILTWPAVIESINREGSPFEPHPPTHPE